MLVNWVSWSNSSGSDPVTFRNKVVFLHSRKAGREIYLGGGGQISVEGRGGEELARAVELCACHADVQFAAWPA